MSTRENAKSAEVETATEPGEATGAKRRRQQARREQQVARTKQGWAGPISCATSRPTTFCRRKTSSSIETDRATASSPRSASSFATILSALDHWKRAGATIDGVLVRFEPGMLREILKSAPGRVHPARAQPGALGGDRRQERRLLAGLRLALRHGPRQGPPLRHDRGFPQLHQARPVVARGCTIRAARSASRSTCRSTNATSTWSSSHIKYSDRGFMGSVTAESRAEDSIEMARIVFGEEFVDRNCVILGNVNVNSPLVWDATMTTRCAPTPAPTRRR